MSAGKKKLIEALVNARVNKKQIQQLDTDWLLEDNDAGVGVMFDIAEYLGWPKLGWKIAATNPILQEKLRTDGPVFGVTFQQFLLSSSATVPFSDLLDPIIEGEFAFKIGKNLAEKKTDYQFEDIADCIESVFMCIEIAECRFHRKHLPSPRHIMADGFASGWYVLGSKVKEWERVLSDGVTVNLYRNGHHHSTGSSHAVMGHPLNPVVWLANRLRRYGRQLQAGDLVSSGSCNILCKAAPGDNFEAVYEGLGSVKVTIN